MPCLLHARQGSGTRQNMAAPALGELRAWQGADQLAPAPQECYSREVLGTRGREEALAQSGGGGSCKEVMTVEMHLEAHVARVKNLAEYLVLSQVLEVVTLELCPL